MTGAIFRIFFHNWKRKAVAVVAAVITWMFVNQSIIDTKMISSVPIRVVNLPADKTILGILPNGILKRRMTLTLSGTKDVIQELEPGDLEVLLDASMYDSEEWIVQITKKNLISLNPSIDISHHVTQVDHAEFILKLSRLVTAKIPITIAPPVGSAPEGYQFLDIWPETLMQTVSGPEEEVEKLQVKGLELVFNIDNISTADLDALTSSSNQAHNDEVSFFVPNKWKQVTIPFQHQLLEQINDPEAANLRIDFLRKDLLSLSEELPIRVFYPVEYSDTLNPKTYSIALGDFIKEKNGITLFTYPLYAQDVSQLFLNIIKDNTEIVIIAAPKTEREILHWNVEILDPRELEDTYVAYLISNLASEGNQHTALSKKREELLRKRFREYTRKLRLYISRNQKLRLRSNLNDDGKVKIFTNIPKES